MTGRLSDRRRCELAIPPRLLYRCFAAAVENGGMDATTDDEQVLHWLDQALIDAVDDPDIKRRGALIRRLNRINKEVMAEWEKRPLLMAFLVVLYWVRNMINEDRIALIADSPFDRAVDALVPRLEAEAGDVWDAMHRSATKGARRLQAKLEGIGYYKN